jgi:hypothetical protein
LNSLLMLLALCLTVITSVGLGVATAYAAVIGILQAFSQNSQLQPESRPAPLILVPSQNQASGD